MVGGVVSFLIKVFYSASNEHFFAKQSRLHRTFKLLNRIDVVA